MPVPVLLRQDKHHEPRDLTPSHGTCCGQTDRAMKTASDQEKTNVQRLGEKMALDHGFLGVPTRTFDEGGRRQFAELLREGLSPETSLLEIGCGCLRTAYWLIPFLGEQNYCGIEPHRDRVRWGLDLLFDDQVLRQRQPRFDHNAEFDLSVFGKKFDMVLAGPSGPIAASLISARCWRVFSRTRTRRRFSSFPTSLRGPRKRTTTAQHGSAQAMFPMNRGSFATASPGSTPSAPVSDFVWIFSTGRPSTDNSGCGYNGHPASAFPAVFKTEPLHAVHETRRKHVEP